MKCRVAHSHKGQEAGPHRSLQCLVLCTVFLILNLTWTFSSPWSSNIPPKSACSVSQVKLYAVASAKAAAPDRATAGSTADIPVTVGRDCSIDGYCVTYIQLDCSSASASITINSTPVIGAATA
ncbi:MAG: hypothetical protein ABIF87_02535 [Pseudomonadota bacterium]